MIVSRFLFSAHELEKVRAIFSSKQSELADAVKKVDVLTHQLDTRKNGESGWGSVPTPERINRRKKIQAAKDELDRLRNELVVSIFMVPFYITVYVFPFSKEILHFKH